MSRCYNKNNVGYKNYGGRGIHVCKRWRKSVTDFHKDMSDCPAGLTLERIDNNKGYNKRNCKWATYKEQHNNRRNNILLTFKDRTQTVPKWAEELNISQRKIRRCIQHGWPAERILN